MANLLPAPVESAPADQGANSGPVPPLLVVIPQPNAVWAVDFMSNTSYCGRRFRTLNVLDEGVREGLAIEVDTSLSAERVTRTLEQAVSWREQPQAIRLDNEPELIAARFMTCVRSG